MHSDIKNKSFSSYVADARERALLRDFAQVSLSNPAISQGAVVVVAAAPVERGVES